MQYNSDVEAVDALYAKYKDLSKEIQKVIIGQDDIVKNVLIGIMSRGHCLLIGVPGLAKTLLVQTIAGVLDLKFNRIQFTPDLMPSDITGSEILDETKPVVVKKNDPVYKLCFHPVDLSSEIELIEVDSIPSDIQDLVDLNQQKKSKRDKSFFTEILFPSR